MEVGTLGIWTNELDRLPGATTREVLQEIEGLGFRTLWFEENPRGREALTNAALILSATERLIVASGGTSIWARDASTTASAQRVLSEAWPYRFILGLGLSHEGLVNAQGHDFSNPLVAMRRYLRGIDIRPAGDLANPPEPPPRVLAALEPEMLELARDHAQGAHSFLLPPEHTHLARQILGPGRLLAPHQGVLLEEDADVARPVLRSHLAARLNDTTYRGMLVRLGWSDAELQDGGSDALVDRLFAWGSISDIAKRVDEHLAAGADHVAVSVLRQKPHGAPLAEWRLLAEIL